MVGASRAHSGSTAENIPARERLPAAPAAGCASAVLSPYHERFLHEATRTMMNRADPFLQARDLLLKHRDRHAEAVRDFRWPRLELFNWALDYLDPLALDNDGTALWITDDE